MSQEMEYIEIEAPYRAAIVTARLPPLVQGETLLAATASGISAGTERMWFDGSAGALKSGRRSYPYRPGYELLGRIVAAGDACAFSPGDRVFAMKPHASHAVLRAEDLCFRLPDHVGDDDALGIGLTATALHAIHRANVTVGDAVAVSGLGTLGLIMIQVLAATVAGPVIALTGSAAKRELALAHGATAAFTYDEALSRRVAPVQCLFECSGLASNPARLAPLLRPQGEIVLAGFYNEPILLDGEALFAASSRSNPSARPAPPVRTTNTIAGTGARISVWRRRW